MAMAWKPPTIPLNKDEVTPSWLTEVLGFEVSTENFTLTSDTEVGNGYLSSLLRVSCVSVEKEEKLNLIVKLLPKDEFMKQLVVIKRLDQTEIECYKTALPRLIEAVPALKDFICPFLYGDYGMQDNSYASVLILHDLKPLQYSPLSFDKRQTEAQIDQGIDFLAKLHFASGLVERKEGQPLPSVFSFISLHDDDEYGMLTDMCKEALLSLVPHLPDDGMKETFHLMSQHTPSMMDYIRNKCSLFPTAVHGDLWSNNILSSKDSTQHTKVIDWQLFNYRDPTLDVGVYLVSSLPDELFTSESLEEHVKKYYDRFTQLCEERDERGLIKRDWPQFLIFFKTYGLAYTMIWFIMSMDGMITKNREKFLIIIDFFYDEMEIPQLIVRDLEKLGIL